MAKSKIFIFSASMILMVLMILMLWRYNDVIESPGVFAGSIAYGFEGRGFIPCKYPDQVWWLEEVDDDFGKEIHFATTGDHYKPAYAVVELSVSSHGSHGHMGMFDRNAKIIKVNSMSTIFPESCSKT
jgi:hypothetical protein